MLQHQLSLQWQCERNRFSKQWTQNVGEAVLLACYISDEDVNHIIGAAQSIPPLPSSFLHSGFAGAVSSHELIVTERAICRTLCVAPPAVWQLLRKCIQIRSDVDKKMLCVEPQPCWNSGSDWQTAWLERYTVHIYIIQYDRYMLAHLTDWCQLWAGNYRLNWIEVCWLFLNRVWFSTAISCSRNHQQSWAQ